MDFSKMIKFLQWNELPAEFLSSMIVCILIMILSLVINVKIRKYDPLTKPTGILLFWEMVVEFVDKQIDDLMGPHYKDSYAGGYIITLGLYIFLGFTWGMLGLPNVLQPGSSSLFKPMPNPFTNTAMPLSIALITFLWLHITAMRCRGWGYFKRYVDPIPFFLPINLLTMWSGTLSLTLRLFGNALAGFCIVTLIYAGFAQISTTSMAGLAITPLITPFVHLYFDMFDGMIQLVVFCMLTMINVSSEYISKEDLQAEKDARKQAKLDRKEEKSNRKRLKEEAKQRKLALKNQEESTSQVKA